MPYWKYLIRRVGIFFLTIWGAATFNFFIPRLSGQNPIQQRLMQGAMGGSTQQGMQIMIDEYNSKFGFDKPLYQQYIRYMTDILHGDFNYSIADYPKKVSSVIQESLPWTIGLLGVSTIIMFFIGSLIGGRMAWSRTPGISKLLMSPIIILNAIPYYLLGLLLIYFLAFKKRIFPLFGGYSPLLFPEWSFSFVWDIIKHAILPAASIILSGLGGWALSMRGMMLTVLGEDYITYAEAKGLKDNTIFYHYGIRNAMLSQVTSLTLSLGYIISGSVLVEVIFNYPGIGSSLFHAIKNFDYFLIQGIVLTMAIAIALGALILDLILPLIDPRINNTEQ